VPRSGGTPDWLAGPKIVDFDRVEWIVMPDPGAAAAALENGEVDWWEDPPNDLLPMLNRSAGVRTETTGPLGTIGTGLFNHLHPPFDKPAVRRVLLEAASQADFMTAAAGTDPKMWRDGIGIFAPGTPMASNAGMDVITGPKRDLPALKAALREADYQGERIVFKAPSD
jgi:peptide/nickel transport system substrate-binding protein